jgi:hypothetical protein
MSELAFPVYTVTEKTAHARWVMETICGDGQAVEFQLRQALRWHNLPDDTPLTRTADKYEPSRVVIVRPVEMSSVGPHAEDLRWIIRRHNYVFTLKQRDDETIDPLRTDPIVPEPA